MDHVNRSETTCNSPAFPQSDRRTMAAPCRRSREGSVRATLTLISFCLIMLLGSPAKGETATDERLALQDTVEIRVSGWHTLLGGAAEAALLNDTFTIGTDGTLELPGIGRLPAAGLRESELAKLITDRLHARSGSNGRPVTTVQRRTPAPEVPSLRATTHVGGRRPAEQPGAVDTEKTELLQAPGRQLSRAEQLLRDLTTARRELDAARGEARAAHQAARDDALRYLQGLAAERQQTASLSQAFSAARADLEAVKAKLGREATAAALERAKSAALEERLAATREEVDAIKKSMQMAGEREEVLRRLLTAARRDLVAARGAADDAGRQARRAADTMAEQGRALEKQRQRAEGLVRDLSTALRQIENLEAKAADAIRSKTAALTARNAAESSLAHARRALDQERHKLKAYERDLAVVRQSTAALQASANLAAADQAAAVQARKVAETAARRADEALALESAKARSLARDLDIARQERDAAKEELTRVLAKLRKASEAERGRGDGSDVASSRKENDTLKARTELRMDIEHVPKSRAGNRASEGTGAAARTGARSIRQTAPRKVHRVGVVQPTPSVATIVLPDALLPTRLLRGRRQ